METLLGGRDVNVTNIKGETEAVKVHQLPIRKYEAGFLKVDDEIGLIAFICDKPKDWALDLQPESFEAVRQAAQEVNAKGFFAYAERKYQKSIQRLNSLSPEILKETLKGANASNPLSPGLRPLPG
jgi:hypothetical protein